MKRKTSAKKSDFGKCSKIKRVVLKITGESLGSSGISEEHLRELAKKLRNISKSGLQIAVVVGGGNILRGANLSGSKYIRKFAAHQMGMIATTINGLAMIETLAAINQPAELFSAFNVGGFVPAYNVKAARKALDDGKVVILAGGTGSPFVTTDTCAAIRSAELGADALLKATKVDGVYSDDPMKNSRAKRYDKISYDDYINKRLEVLDLTAVRICQEASVPIVVFNLENLNKLMHVISGKINRTIICNSK